MKTQNLNNSIQTALDSLEEIQTMFFIASDEENTACCVGGSVMDIANLLANVFDKQEHIMMAAEMAIQAVKERQTKNSLSNIFEC